MKNEIVYDLINEVELLRYKLLNMEENFKILYNNVVSATMLIKVVSEILLKKEIANKTEFKKYHNNISKKYKKELIKKTKEMNELYKNQYFNDLMNSDIYGNS